jgi:hypothetical protein
MHRIAVEDDTSSGRCAGSFQSPEPESAPVAAPSPAARDAPPRPRPLRRVSKAQGRAHRTARLAVQGRRGRRVGSCVGQATVTSEQTRKIGGPRGRAVGPVRRVSSSPPPEWSDGTTRGEDDDGLHARFVQDRARAAALDFEEYYPNGCPTDAYTFRALLVILEHVNLDKASDEISDAWYALLTWVDGYC